MTLGFGGAFTELETSGTKKVGAVSRRVCLAFKKNRPWKYFQRPAKKYFYLNILTLQLRSFPYSI